MRIYWTKEEESKLKYYYEDLGLSLSELYNSFIEYYPHRTKTSVEIKISKLKLKHTKEQTSDIKSRLNSGEGNGMFGKIGPNNGLTKENSKRIENASIKISKTRLEMSKNGNLPSTSGENNGMYGKESWNKNKTKYTDDRLVDKNNKKSISAKNRWFNLSDEDKDRRIGNLSLAANKAKKDTKIEIIIRDKLESMNIDFIKNYRYNKYIFDFYLIDYNFVIECQGDYWHGNPDLFKTLNDIQLKNIERDKNKKRYLEESRIKSLFLWENEIYRYKENLEEIITNKINDN
jgi:G:T-mismatch repair DNA endonuclease (very short patch repair protein)